MNKYKKYGYLSIMLVSFFLISLCCVSATDTGNNNTQSNGAVLTDSSDTAKLPQTKAISDTGNTGNEIKDTGQDLEKDDSSRKISTTEIYKNEGQTKKTVDNEKSLKTAAVDVSDYESLKNSITTFEPSQDDNTLTINLNSGVYDVDDEGIIIDGNNYYNLIINGNQNTINGNGNHVLSIAHGFNVTLNSLDINNASSTNGGAIINNGTLNMYDTDFINNSAARTGGAIVNLATLVIDDCGFYNNEANTSSAIYNEGYLNIKNSVFFNNTSLNNGAITNYKGNLTLETVLFSLNKARWGAGVISYEGSLNISMSYFMSNIATYGALVIHNSTNVSTINNTVFKDNAASYGAALIILDRGNAYVDNSDFLNNIASNNGGAIYNQGSNLTINNTRLNNNSAYDTAGAIYNDVNSSLVVDNSTFNNNSALFSSAIYNNGTLVLNNSYIQYNNATYNGTITNDKNATIMYNLIAYNQANTGSFISTSADSQTIINNNTVEYNNVIEGFIVNNIADTSITNNNFIENTNTNGEDALFYQVNGMNENTAGCNNTFTGNNLNTTMTVSEPIVTYDNITFNITTRLNPVYNSTPTGIVTINGTDSYAYNVTQELTTVVIPCANLTKGNYTYTITFSSIDNSYQTQTSTIIVEVPKLKNPTLDLITDNITAKRGQNITLVALITDNGMIVNGGFVSFKLNGKTLLDANGTANRIKVANGTAMFIYQIPYNYSAKTYNITVVYGGGNYLRAEDYGTLAILKASSHVQANILNITQNGTANLRVNVYDEDNNIIDFRNTTVSIKVNGKTVLSGVKVVNGVADFNLSLLPNAKAYTITVVTGDNSHFLASQTNLTYTNPNPKLNTTVTINNITSQNGNKAVVDATIKDSNGNLVVGNTKVAIKVDGKTVLNTVAANGTINEAINITNGTHEVLVVAGQTDTYNASKNATTVLI